MRCDLKLENCSLIGGRGFWVVGTDTGKRSMEGEGNTGEWEVEGGGGLKVRVYKEGEREREREVGFVISDRGSRA